MYIYRAKLFVGNEGLHSFDKLKIIEVFFCIMKLNLMIIN